VAQDPLIPVINVTRFHRQHDLPAGEQPKGQLLHGLDNNGNPKRSLGYFRGTNLEAGFTVQVYTGNRKKTWEGEITEAVDDSWTPSEGPAWFFWVVNKKHEADPGEDDSIVVTVTVTNPTGPTTSTPVTASPNPTDVP